MNYQSHYIELAARFCRGTLGLPQSTSDQDCLAKGQKTGLKLHKFKRNSELPRVRKVLGMLHGFSPQSLLDVGSGRGTFLWPLLDAFSDLFITSVDLHPIRARDTAAISKGGQKNLHSINANVENLPFRSDSVNIVTVLEVLEHTKTPEKAVSEALRVAQTHVIASVPSKPDNNPEHIHLFSADDLQNLFYHGGASRVSLTPVLNHLICIAKV